MKLALHEKVGSTVKRRRFSNKGESARISEKVRRILIY